MAEEYFEDWFPGAMQKYEGAKFHIEKRHLKPAAFDLHQTAEMLYHCILLVETFYTPHVHNLIFLRKQAERIDRRLRSEEHTSELQSLMRISYAVFCLKKKNSIVINIIYTTKY